jgi:hypothetical protein
LRETAFDNALTVQPGILHSADGVGNSALTLHRMDKYSLEAGAFAAPD